MTGPVGGTWRQLIGDKLYWCHLHRALFVASREQPGWGYVVETTMHACVCADCADAHANVKDEGES